MTDGEKGRDMRKGENVQRYFLQRRIGGGKKRESWRSKIQLSKRCRTMAGLEHRWSLTCL